MLAILGPIAGALFPVACPSCGARGAAACERCLEQVRPPPPLPPPFGIDRWAAAFAYEGVVRELIARVKYRDERHALSWLARHAAAAAEAQLARPGLVTWAPTTRARRRERGFDHAAALAHRVAVELGVPCRALLVRADGPPQTGRPARDRRDGPGFGLRAGAGGRVEGIRVLVVDDVTTTGATLRAAARALRPASSAVDALTVARTRPPS